MSSEKLENIKAEMCDKYCRYPFSADEDLILRNLSAEHLRSGGHLFINSM